MLTNIYIHNTTQNNAFLNKRLTENSINSPAFGNYNFDFLAKSKVVMTGVKQTYYCFKATAFLWIVKVIKNLLIPPSSPKETIVDKYLTEGALASSILTVGIFSLTYLYALYLLYKNKRSSK